MTSRRFLLVLVAACAAAVAGPVLAGGDGDDRGGAKPEAERPQHARDVAPLLDRYCLGCHMGAQPEGEVALDPFLDETKARARTKTLRAMRDKLAAGEMPPENGQQPTQDERRAAIAWIDAALGGALADPSGAYLLRAELGAADRRKIDEYLTAVRELEQRIDRAAATGTQAQRAPRRRPAPCARRASRATSASTRA